MPITLEDKREATTATLTAALAWWESKRPEKYDLRAHLDAPTVNTTTDAERTLAAAVAASVEVGAL